MLNTFSFRSSRLARLVLLFAALATGACATDGNLQQIDPVAETPATATASKQLASAKQDFLQSPEFLAQFKRLNELEQQALQLAADEPLKLGSLGSAILDIYPASQTGHFALQQFYAHVDAADTHARHSTLLQHLQAQMLAQGDGSKDAPFPVMTVYDAQTYLRTRQQLPVGSIFQSNREQPLGYLLVTRPTTGPLQHTVFDLQHLLAGFAHNSSSQSAGSDGEPVNSAPPAQSEPAIANPWVLIRLFAAAGEPGAHTAIGAYLASLQKYDQAVGWLRTASRSGNVLANRLLARIYFTRAEQTDSSEEKAAFKDLALENHMHAITQGSADSMYTLANLYLNNYFGEDNRQAGLPLLQQAADLGHTESLIFLGHLYNNGAEVDLDAARADEYFRQAAQSDNPQALLNYGRFLGADNARRANPSMFAALEQLARTDHAEGMVVLGNLYARGIGAKASTRAAIRWYKRAVKQAADDPDIVNEVAWTLTVSDIEGLQRGKYAKRIMDTLMENKEARDRPEYLDTWAAAHAAIGDFEQAVKLQQQAIEVATSQQRTDVMDILKKHLEQFKTGNTITEAAP